MSAYARLGARDVLSGSIRYPLSGAWEASLELDGGAADVPTGMVELRLGSRSWLGHVVAAEADDGGQVSARVIGGAGQLGAELPPKAYGPTTRGLVLADALAEVGERLSPASDEALLRIALPRWARRRQTAGELVRAVLAGTGASWRMDASGAVVVAVDTWPTLVADGLVESESPTRESMVVASESVDVLPGIQFELRSAGFTPRRVTQSTYAIGPGGSRIEVSYASEPRSEAAAQLARFVARETGAASLYRPVSGRIIVQNPDGSFEIRTNDRDLPDLSRVPAKLGLPGVGSIAAVPGGEVYLIFEDGDPQRPCVVGFAPGAASSVSFLAQSIELGGVSPLAIAAPIEAWASAVGSALAGLGAPVLPLVGASAVIAKGA